MNDGVHEKVIDEEDGGAHTGRSAIKVGTEGDVDDPPLLHPGHG